MKLNTISVSSKWLQFREMDYQKWVLLNYKVNTIK